MKGIDFSMFSMEKERKYEMMDHLMKGTLLMGRNTDLGHSNGQMVVSMKEVLKAI